MQSFTPYWAFCLLVIFVLFPGRASARTWTNSEGRRIEAEFVELKGSQVAILMDGRRFEVPLASLSEDDQAYAKAESQRRLELAAVEARKFMGQTLEKGKMLVFKHRLSKANQRIAARGGAGWSGKFTNSSDDGLYETPKLQEITVALGIPDNFDPAKSCPIFVQWTTGDIKSNVKGARQYWNDCRKKGWILVSVDGSPDSTKTWTVSVFYAGIKEFFEQLHQKYPGSEAWPVATGGFSGGAKVCQWMGGVMSEMEGVDLKGFWIGGCNEASFDLALEDLSVSKRAYRRKKAFISSGNADPLVTDRYRRHVEEGADDVGLDVRSEIYDGGHQRNSQHFKSALDWFLE